MSIETSPEQGVNYHTAKLEKIVAALRVWQEEPDDAENAHTAPADPYADADALEDILREHGLQILPTVSGDALYRVLVDGHPAPYVGQARPAGPVDANDAAEMFLAEASKAESVDRTRAITVHPATDNELTSSLWNDITGGAA
ncbi:hypothetical protein OG884_18405 [Streptosporangium sp. NBC_01755]|uniref:hypothetical protein n=1 Tax=Streptosporangium sp. NBC_01755 TaxID=2975949 RepID=UPI002DDA6ECC|nr:hypothetical protein [Streptosporangium sp. NBC_01755]WSD03779.1 hypothetical protein OG884_18405 [Streptosporangium sp. NBC_01755]